MPFGFIVFRRSCVQRVALVNVPPYWAVEFIPDRACVFLPVRNGEAFVRVRHSVWIIPRLAHEHYIIGDTHARHARILFKLLMQQAQRFCSLHGCNRILPDANLRMIDKPDFLKCANQIPAKITNPDIAVFLFAGREIHAMNSHNPPRLQDTEKLFRDKREVQEKFCAIFAVA